VEAGEEALFQPITDQLLLGHFPRRVDPEDALLNGGLELEGLLNGISIPALEGDGGKVGDGVGILGQVEVSVVLVGSDLIVVSSGGEAEWSQDVLVPPCLLQDVVGINVLLMGHPLLEKGEGAALAGIHSNNHDGSIGVEVDVVVGVPPRGGVGGINGGGRGTGGQEGINVNLVLVVVIIIGLRWSSLVGDGIAGLWDGSDEDHLDAVRDNSGDGMVLAVRWTEGRPRISLCMRKQTSKN